MSSNNIGSKTEAADPQHPIPVRSPLYRLLELAARGIAGDLKRGISVKCPENPRDRQRLIDQNNCADRSTPLR